MAVKGGDNNLSSFKGVEHHVRPQKRDRCHCLVKIKSLGLLRKIDGNSFFPIDQLDADGQCIAETKAQAQEEGCSLVMDLRSFTTSIEECPAADKTPVPV